MKCPKCDFDGMTARGLKAHMTRAHGGYDDSDIPSNSGSTTPDVARNLTGYPSSAAVTQAAPETDVPTKPERAKRGSYVSIAEREEAEKRKIARERIGRPLMSRLASMPYKAWATLAGDPALSLEPQEEESIAAAYLNLAEAYDADFTGKLWAIGAVISANADAIAARLDKATGLKGAGDIIRGTMGEPEKVN